MNRIVAILVIGLALVAVPVFAQAKKPAAAAEPATVESAAKVLDLRTFPVMEGAKVGSQRSLGMLMYQAKGEPKAAFEFQRSRLLKAGFKEQPGYQDASNQNGDFTKEGFRIRVSASAITSDPQEKGWSQVSIVNDGNVSLKKLPVPPGVKPFHPEAFDAAYTTDLKVAEAAEACRKLLLAAGWEPYGQADSNATDAESQIHYFKRNAIKLMSWVSKAPADGGKTLIRYSTELLQADLPVPPKIDPQYSDFQKTLRFDAPNDQTDAIVAFYQERLPKQGWQATTERPVVDDRKKSQFLVYRNPQKDLLSLDLTQFTDIVRVKLQQQTAAEVAEEEKRFKEQAEREKAELASKNRKIKVAVPLPPGAKKLEKPEANYFEFKLASGGGAAALTAFRDHFRKAGWTEEKGSELDETSGNLHMLKDDVRISFTYFDLGISDVDVTVSAPKNVEFDPQLSKEKPTAGAKPAKKPKAGIPGLPDLPEGVELPDDVNELLKKALQEAEDAKPPAAKKPTPKKPTR